MVDDERSAITATLRQLFAGELTVDEAAGRLDAMGVTQLDILSAVTMPAGSELMTDDERIAVVEVKVRVCALCLNGAGGECHVPGCAFWMNAAPNADLALLLRQWGEI